MLCGRYAHADDNTRFVEYTLGRKTLTEKAMGRVTRLFILSEKYDEILNLFESFSVEDWCDFTEDWHHIDERIGGATRLIVEAYNMKPHSERVRRAKRYLQPKRLEQQEPVVNLEEHRLKQFLREGLKGAAEFCAIFFALSDETLERAYEALRRNGKIVTPSV